jgi:Rrf2 family protein
MRRVKVSAKTDYAVRAMIELAGATEERPVPGERIAGAQEIPLRFLEPILSDLRFAGLLQRRPGEDGGYWLARPPGELTLAEIISELEGPLAGIRGEPPEELSFRGDAQPLREVWIALGASMRQVLDSVTIADLASGQLPEPVRAIAVRSDVRQIGS